MILSLSNIPKRAKKNLYTDTLPILTLFTVDIFVGCGHDGFEKKFPAENNLNEVGIYYALVGLRYYRLRE